MADLTDQGGESLPAGVIMDEATLVGRPGFHRVGRSTAGRWWLVRPDGRGFLYKGCCAVCYGGGEYRAFCDERYRGDDRRFLGEAEAVLREFGFNAFGNWNFLFCESPPHWDHGWPFVEYIHAREVCPEATVKQGAVKHIDVFDPRWHAAYDKACEATCAPLRDNPHLVGYFTDNEPSWAQQGALSVFGGIETTGDEPVLLQEFLALPADRAGHRAAWDWALKRRGGDVQRLAADWQAPFDSPQDLRRRHERGLVLRSQGFLADHAEFTRLFAREYFRVTGEAIRRHDPNHLVLGVREGGPPGAFVLESYVRARDAGHVDVLTMNNYRTDFYGRIDEYYQPTKMPILNGEFSWGAFGMTWEKYCSGAAFSAEEIQANRRLGTAALEGAFTHPGLVGYTWFKWYVNGGRGLDQPAFALVDQAGQVNRWNAAMLKPIHARLEAIARGKAKPRLAEDA